MSIQSGDGGSRFQASIGADGSISVRPRDGATFDFETEAETIELVLALQDGDFTTQVPYTMTVQDVAEAPLLSQDTATASFDENTEGPVTLATFTATGIDSVDQPVSLDQFTVSCNSNTDPAVSRDDDVQASMAVPGEVTLTYTGAGEDFESDDTHSSFTCTVCAQGRGFEEGPPGEQPQNPEIIGELGVAQTISKFPVSSSSALAREIGF